MNKFKFYFIVLCAAVTLFSCGGGDDTRVSPPRDYAVQYVQDTTAINEYLNNYHIEFTNNPTGNDDQDVVFSKKDDTHLSIMDMYKHNAANGIYPQLLYKDVTLPNDDNNTVSYKVYYIKLRADSAEGQSPSEVDEVLTSYNGSYLTYVSSKVDDVTITTLTATPFEYTPFPELYFRLDRTIKGWSKMFPLFKSGTIETTQGPNPTHYNNFGAGILFIPSGLAYFNFGTTVIPAYAPLIFSIKLYDVKRADHDGDGILSNDEDVNGNGDFTDDDTDDDKIQNYLDTDDDGDGYSTKYETKKPAAALDPLNTDLYSGTSLYYPFSPTLDNPDTTDVNESETKGVPSCGSDYTTPTRVRKYLDPSCP